MLAETEAIIAADSETDWGLHQAEQGNESRFSVGIVGAGDIARSAHLPTLRALANADVAWVTDVDPGRAEAVGRAYKVRHCPLPQDLSRLPQADVVLLAIPYGVRMPYYEVLRERNCAVYVEKPLARTVEEHRRICSWFPDYALASGLMMRCWGTNLLIREAIDSHLFGSLRAVRFGFGRPGLVTHGRYYFDTSKGGGGMVSEVGIHGIDSLLFATRAVSAGIDDVRVVWDRDLDLHTDVRLTLRLPKGASAACRITVTAMESTIDGMEFEFDHAVLSYPLLGQGYALHGDSVDMNVTVRPLGAGNSYTLLPDKSRSFPSTKFQMFHDNWRRFLAGFRTGQANWTAADQSMLTTEVVQMIGQAGAR